MSFFSRELNGDFGFYRMSDAQNRIAKATEDYNKGKITVDENGIARNCIGRVLSDDFAEVFEYADCCPWFSRTATAEAYDIEISKSIEEYKKNKQEPSFEELAEMRAAFGAGTTVVDALTGEKIIL